MASDDQQRDDVAKAPGKAKQGWWHEQFLVELAKTRSVTQACRSVGLKDNTAAYRYRKKNTKWAERWNAIVRSWDDELEASALRRAIEGTANVVTFKGRIVFQHDENGALLLDKKTGKPVPLIERTFEQATTIFMLKKRKPEVYGDDTAADGATALEHAAAVRQALAGAMDFFVAAAPMTTSTDPAPDGAAAQAPAPEA